VEANSQEADSKPGFYYVSVVKGHDNFRLLRGPFVNDHAGALAAVEWVNGDPDSGIGCISTTACIVADLFEKTEDQVRADLKRELARRNRSSPG
jgi:hypothetical protein